MELGFRSSLELGFELEVLLSVLGRVHGSLTFAVARSTC